MALMSFISFFFSFFICCPYGKNLNMVFCSLQMSRIIKIFETIDNKRIDVKHEAMELLLVRKLRQICGK
jgi:hypothetical protein